MRNFFRGCILMLAIGLLPQRASTQCTAAFDVQSAVCRETNLFFQNVTLGAETYEWDFCSGDLETAPTAQSVVSSSVLFRARSLKVKYDGSNYVGFALSEPNGQLIRLNFGSSLLNTPSITNLGNFSNNIERAWGFTVYEENGSWYCFIPDFNDGSLIKLSFGSSLLAAPTMQNLGNFSNLLRFPAGMSIVSESGQVYGFVCNAGPGASEILKLNFGTSVANTPTASVIPVTGGNFLMDISFIKECDQWIALATSFDNRKVFYLDFINGLANAPSIGELNLPNLPFNPCAISVQREGGNFYGFIQHIDGLVFRIDFGSSILDHAGTENNLGTLGVSNSNFAFDVIHEASDWYGFSIDLSGSVTPGEGRLMRLNFPNICSANVETSSSPVPDQVHYTAAGSYKISLTVENPSGEIATISKTVSVSSLQAPDIDFTSQNICANHDVLFASQNTSGNISSYIWAFGDGGISTLPNPTHQFTSAGVYQPRLVVTASNACENSVQKNITIYNQTIADFTLPTASPLCTNQSQLFTNTTADIGITPVWEWSVSNGPVSSSEDLVYTFTSAANQEVKLKASIPGCESEKAVTINTLVVGPIADFTITGRCEDSNVMFTNTSSGTVSGYTWNFGDGQTSGSTNPVNIFADPGTYTVVLTASNAAGCNNTASQQLTVYSVPQVNFIALAPPFSCSGTPTQFNDQTPPPSDSNLSSWLWNFGDAGNPSNTSTQRNPQHTYASAGDYAVSLTVTNNFLCSATLQKSVTIYQTPDAAFTHSALCEDGVVTFSDAATNNQAWNWQIGSSFYTTETAEHTFTNPGSYEVSLSVTALNNCIGTAEETVVIAPKLPMDFSVLRNCINQQTEFTDLTNNASDPITDIQWSFGNFGNAQISPAIFTFVETGTIDVTLTVTTESGCEYLLTKPVTVSAGPLAAFTAEPNSGEAPLPVQFTNTSLNATAYSWNFGEGSTSNSSSPSFIYTDKGAYTIELIATDVNNCADSTRQLIEVTEPAELDPPTPNPSTGAFAVEWKTTDAVKTILALIDASGREIRNFEVAANPGINRIVLDVTGEQTGLYILRIQYSNTIKTYRLIIAR